MARRFVANYPGTGDGTGILFTGTSGTGKTHLATAILRTLLPGKNVPAMFCDYRDLLRLLKNSYSPSAYQTEHGILRPILEVELLVLDELGATKVTEWTLDVVGLVLNTRYNECRTTIITTNYPDLAPSAASQEGGVRLHGMR